MSLRFYCAVFSRFKYIGNLDGNFQFEYWIKAIHKSRYMSNLTIYRDRSLYIFIYVDNLDRRQLTRLETRAYIWEVRIVLQYTNKICKCAFGWKRLADSGIRTIRRHGGFDQDEDSPSWCTGTGRMSRVAAGGAFDISSSDWTADTGPCF